MKTFVPALVILLGVLLAGCAATQQAETVQSTGFLAPYRSLLAQGQRGKEALLVYRNPQADWASYKAIHLMSVQLWTTPGSQLSAEQKLDLQELVDSFYVTLYDKLSQDYAMVQTSGPGVMQIQIAISHGEPSHTGLSVASKVILPVKLASSMWSFASGKPFFTGEVTIEAVVKDAATGEVLGVGADRRVGGVKLFTPNVLSSWGDVKNSLNFYADAAVWRLCLLRGGTHCVKPKA